MIDRSVFQRYDEQCPDRINIDMVGAMAATLIEKWGMVVGYRRQEDQTACLRTEDLLPVDDVVDRAFDIAKKTVARLQAEGCLKDLGPLSERESEALRFLTEAKARRTQ